MREIKFRAWDYETKRMADVRAIDWGWDDGKSIITTCHLQFKDGEVVKRYPEPEYGDKVELMQYVGLKDKNGKEIWESDIVRIRETSIDDWDVYKIEYHGDRKYPAFDTVPSIDCDCNGLSYAMAAGEIEVIGNIHDNGDLLSENDKEGLARTS